MTPLTLRPILAFAVATVLATACDQAIVPTVAGIGTGGTSTSGGTSTQTAPLVINPSQVNLALGGSFQLATNAAAGVQADVRWSSLQPNIATVSSSGLVMGVGLGTATIMARYSFDTTNVATTTVNVTAGTTGTGSTGSP